MRYYLLTGDMAPERIHGWVALAQAGLYGEPVPAHVWAAHADTLTTEAEANGFEPYQVTRRPPTGPGFTRWQAAFLKRHTY